MSRNEKIKNVLILRTVFDEEEVKRTSILVWGLV